MLDVLSTGFASHCEAVCLSEVLHSSLSVHLASRTHTPLLSEQYLFITARLSLQFALFLSHFLISSSVLPLFFDTTLGSIPSSTRNSLNFFHFFLLHWWILRRDARAFYLSISFPFYHLLHFTSVQDWKLRKLTFTTCYVLIMFTDIYYLDSLCH